MGQDLQIKIWGEEEWPVKGGDLQPREGGRGSYHASRGFRKARVTIGCTFEFYAPNERRIVDIREETIPTSLTLLYFAFEDACVAWRLESWFCSIQMIRAKLTAFVTCTDPNVLLSGPACALLDRAVGSVHLPVGTSDGHT
ncbi:hypothetical protein CRG98_019883 [Punica granatum]|uniref:Uncharacterized protein n=1 Tax=Punica granatum TaxID=22663 RepID=A0A2I0JTR0_PUNGR|nr:hypothetical protein CRG98_019883 [Punica granatum]